MNSLALIIPAAGSGERLNREIPKPYIEVAGKTILEHTLARFISIKELREVVIATSEEYLDTARSICQRVVHGEISNTCVAGGAERQNSIFNALQKIGTVDLVAVHDAVRPFVDKKNILHCMQVAEEDGGAVMGVPAKDTIKKVDRNRVITETPDRKFLWQTQTPQIFRKEILVAAHKKAEEENFLGTDDSSLVEHLGHKVKMVRGDYTNFKITYPIDLKLAEMLLEGNE